MANPDSAQLSMGAPETCHQDYAQRISQLITAQGFIAFGQGAATVEPKAAIAPASLKSSALAT